MDYQEQATEPHPPPHAMPEHRLGHHRRAPDKATAVRSRANYAPLGETLEVALGPAQLSLTDTAGVVSVLWRPPNAAYIQKKA